MIDANLTHGQSTMSARKVHSKVSARLSTLEDCMYVLGMTAEPRIRGRKPVGYIKVHSLDDVRRVLRVLTP
jgi:hypothetical protein